MNLRTEASSRFEKSLDPELTSIAIERFVALLKNIDKNIDISSCLTDRYLNKYEKKSIEINKKYIEKYIGQPINKKQIIEILNSLEFVVENNDDNFIINVPSFRATKDISIKADIVEEIARIYGYDNIAMKSTEITLEPLQYNENRIIEHNVKDILAVNFGFSEVHSYIWEDEELNQRSGR